MATSFVDFSNHVYILPSKYLARMHDTDEYSDEPVVFTKVAGIFCGLMLLATVLAFVYITL